MNYDFNFVYNTYSDKIRRYLNCSFSIEDSEDLFQEIFIKINNSLSTFKGNSSLKTWIFKIATNAMIDRFKSNSFKLYKSSTEISHLHFNNNHYSSTFEKQIEKKEMNDCIRKFINELTDTNRSVFVLSVYEELSNKEIAEILKISLETIKIRIYRAKETLKNSLSNHCHITFEENSVSCVPK